MTEPHMVDPAVKKSSNKNIVNGPEMHYQPLQDLIYLKKWLLKWVASSQAEWIFYGVDTVKQ